jgi:hypothetical protein
MKKPVEIKGLNVMPLKFLFLMIIDDLIAEF